MSVFIKVDKFGAGKRLFRCRGLNTTFGEDAHGILTSENPTDPIFTIYRRSENVIIKSHKDGMKLDGTPLKKDEQLSLSDQHEFVFGDYHFYLFNIPAEIEVISNSKATLDDFLKIGTSTPTLHYNLAMFKRSFPLPEDIEITVGAGQECSIQIELKQLGNPHFKLINKNGVIKLTALKGGLSFNNTKLLPEKSAKIYKTTVIRLEPTNLEITIEIP